MKDIINVAQLVFTAIGGFLGWLLGGWDGFLYALVTLVSMDYITGLIAAGVEKKLSSEVGFRGIAKLYETSYNLNYANSMFMRTFLAKMR